MARDLTGQRFGTLTVVKRAPNMYSGRMVAWLCKCDCGNEKVVPANNIQNVRSCGCLTKQLRRIGSTFMCSRGSTWTDIHRKRKQLTAEFVKNNLPAAQALGMI